MVLGSLERHIVQGKYYSLVIVIAELFLLLGLFGTLRITFKRIRG